MRSLLGLVVLAIGVVGAQDPKPADEEAKDRAALQGTWELEQLEINGKKTPAEDLKKVAARVTIADQSIAFWSPLNKKGTFTLDTSKTPRWIDVEDTRVVKDSKDSKDAKDSKDTKDVKKTKELGIYEVKGDELKICTARPGGERPKEFVSKTPGKDVSETTLLVFKRVVKKESEKDKDTPKDKDKDTKDKDAPKDKDAKDKDSKDKDSKDKDVKDKKG
jgi:uncharacterized protein (TIGR03067 family)